MRVDFDYTCYRRALNDILMDSLMNLKLHKILRNILISGATIGISVNTVYKNTSWQLLGFFCDS
jgi:hypothetical protein